MPELKAINSTDSEWHIGAAVTLTQIEEKMAAEFPALGRMLRVFGFDKAAIKGIVEEGRAGTEELDVGVEGYLILAD